MKSINKPGMKYENYITKIQENHEVIRKSGTTSHHVNQTCWNFATILDWQRSWHYTINGTFSEKSRIFAVLS